MAVIIVAIVLGILVAGGAALGVYAHHNITYAAHDRQKATDAGFIELRALLSTGTELNYAEGPDNGRALVLLHAQGTAWESYARVLPGLAEDFHVFAVDIAGHGSSSRTPGRYDIASIGGDLREFLDTVVGEPVILSGHSSGGLIAVWLAADSPERVSGLVLEDPPLFSTEPDRMPVQFNYVDLATPAHEFLAQDEETDFAAYYIAHNAWIGYFGGGRDGIVGYAQDYREKHPDQPLNLWFLPAVTNESFAAMHEFDPEFADAFYTMDWQGGFDQAEALAAIEQPTTLIHANWRMHEGILEGAMTDDDAARACALLAACIPERVSTGHGFHFEDPQRFVRLVQELAARL